MNDDDTKKPKLTKADLTVFTSAALQPSIKSQGSDTFCFSVKAISDPDKFKDDPSYEARSFFEEFRFRESMKIRVNNMIDHLRNEGVTDYDLRLTPKTTDFIFLSQKDCNIAAMAFLNEKEYVVELSRPDGELKLDEAKALVQKLSTEFTQAGFRVKLQIDQQSRQIHALMPDRRAYVDFLGDYWAIKLNI